MNQSREQETTDGESSEAPAEPEASGARVASPIPNAPAEEPGAQPLPRMLGERYRLTALIAKGGMGRVYEAIQLPLERKVAVKLLVAPPNVGGDFRRRFLLEASVCARLTHPNIVVVHDYGETAAGELFMAMELLDGQTLDALLATNGPLEPLRATTIAIAIARAVRAAHLAGVAHRDLKPGNVFVRPGRGDDEGEGESVKVLDFGLVKVYDDGRASVERDLTEGDIMLGSPRYMAPEQIQCESVDQRCDIYSLGALIFAMICGRPPFVGRSAIDILTQHIQRPVPSFAEVFREQSAPERREPPHPLDAGLEAVVHRCMRKAPDERYASMDELIAALREVRDRLAGGDVSDSFDSARAGLAIPAPADREALEVDVDPPRAPRPRWPLIAALLGGAVAIALVASFALPSSAPEPIQPPPAPVVELEAPAAEPPPGVPTVTVTVTSAPAGAEVLSGGVLLGVTPLTRALRPTPEGARRVFELRLEGHESARVARAITGDEVALHAELTPIAPVVEEPEAEEPQPAPVRRQRVRPARDVARREAREEPEPAPEPRSIAVDRGGSGVPIVE